MLVSVKKKISGEVSYVDVVAELPELIKREVAETVGQRSSGVATPAATVQSIPVQKPAVEPTPQPQVVAQPTPMRKPVIFNLNELLSGGISQPSAEGEKSEDTQESVAAVVVDPQCEQKLKSVWDKVLKYFGSLKPRYVAPFESAEIVGNVIKVKVPSDVLYEDLLRNKIDLLLKLVEMANIQGVVELEVEMDEEASKSSVPIKLEDRIAFIMGLNPLIIKFKEALDLEVDG